ncbi:hypothetical protein ACFPRL_35605 [Pseudoclavibacter helvolus]
MGALRGSHTDDPGRLRRGLVGRGGEAAKRLVHGGAAIAGVRGDAAHVGLDRELCGLRHVEAEGVEDGAGAVRARADA